MSDRYHSLTVVLDHDIRDDDAQDIINSIAMIRGVLEVAPHIADNVTYMAESRARRDLGQKLLKIIYPDENPNHPYP